MPTEVTVENLKLLDWYHPNTTRHIAETLLLQNGEEGAYILRSKTDATDEDFVLSVRTKDSVKHFEVNIKNSELNFGFGTFYSIDEFIDHFDTQPLIAGENGVLTVIRFPYPHKVDEPAVYDTVRIHASVGKNRSIRDHKALAVGSKEGYLTKLGGIVKNWKTRWFTLNKNELKYFKDRSSTTAIKTINLSECLSSKSDTSMNKDNCFSLELPWRTFYMFAATREEAQEWITVLNWKLKKSKESKEKQAMTM